MSKQQTAVEWLIEEQRKALTEYSVGNLSFAGYVNLMADKEKKAKEMMKEQIENAHLAGQDCKTDFPMGEFAEHYYTQTYGGEQ